MHTLFTVPETHQVVLCVTLLHHTQQQKGYFSFNLSHFTPSIHTKIKLTLFLCAFTDAYRTVPRNPATLRG